MEAVGSFSNQKGPKGCLVVLGATNCSVESSDVVKAMAVRRRIAEAAVRDRIDAGRAAGELAVPRSSSFPRVLIRNVTSCPRNWKTQHAKRRSINVVCAEIKVPPGLKPLAFISLDSINVSTTPYLERSRQ
jgi:hypothetical protein